MQDRIEYTLFIILSFIVRLIGLGPSRRLSYLLAALFYYVIPIRKKTVKENLQKAFPGYNKSQINKIAFGSYKSFCITFIEILSEYSFITLKVLSVDKPSTIMYSKSL